MDSSTPQGKYAHFEMHDGCLHIIFKSEIDAIEMMPKGPSVFERNGNVIVMNPKHPYAEQLRRERYLEEE